MPLFSTTFSPPPILTGLTLTADVAQSAVVLEWNPSALAGDFVQYSVYRSLDNGSTWEQIAVLTAEGTATYTDFTAPLGVPILYAVSVWNTTGFESPRAEAATALDVTTWWLVTPGDTGLTFALAVTTGYDDETPVEDEEFTPLGRDRKMVVFGEVLGQEGTLTVDLSRENAGLHRLLQVALGLAREFVYVKSPFGDVYPVRLRSIRRKRGVAGRQTVTIPFVEVA